MKPTLTTLPNSQTKPNPFSSILLSPHFPNTTHQKLTRHTTTPESPSMDPTLLKKQQQLKATSSYHPSPKNPDPILPARPFNLSKHLSRLYPNHKTDVTSTTQKPCKNNPPPTCRDIHLQAKSMTLSADFDAYKFSHVKTKHHQTVETKVVKEACKEKVNKNDSNSEVQEMEKKKKEVKGLAVVEGHEVLKRMSVSSVGGGGGGGGRRRSFCGSQVELSDFLASNGAKVVSVDMPPFMQIHAVDCARKTRDSLEKFTSKTLALTLKKEFDGVYGPAWHCIVGTSFGSFVTHSVGGFLYFSLDQKLYILLFKTTVQRAD